MNTKQFEAVKYGLGFDYSIHGVDEYDKYAVLVLLAPRDGVYNFVLEKRDSQIRQGGEICFPGGKAESEDAGFEHTALRETFEEIGIPPDSIEIVGRLATMLAPRGLSIEPFIGVASSLDVLSINLEEVAQLIVLPISYFMNNEPERHAVRVQLLPRVVDEATGKVDTLLPSEELDLPSAYHKPWGDYNHTVLVYRTAYGPIWGITARLIYECVEKMRLSLDRLAE